MSGSVVCPSCGHEIDDADGVCAVCGFAVRLGAATRGRAAVDAALDSAADAAVDGPTYPAPGPHQRSGGGEPAAVADLRRRPRSALVEPLSAAAGADRRRGRSGGGGRRRRARLGGRLDVCRVACRGGPPRVWRRADRGARVFGQFVGRVVVGRFAEGRGP